MLTAPRPLVLPAAALALADGASVAAEAAPVREMQGRLVSEGYLDAEDVTGTLDPRTGAAVARYQAERGLPAHGVVDETTADRLLGRTPERSHR